MTLRQYLLLMTIATAICWTAWFFVISNIDPTATNWVGYLFFYVSLFLALTGTFSVIGFGIRSRWVKNNEIVFHHVRHAFRQGILLSSLIIIALLLLQYKVLTWWNGILIILLFLILESLIFTNRKYKNRDLF